MLGHFKFLYFVKFFIPDPILMGLVVEKNKEGIYFTCVISYGI